MDTLKQLLNLVAGSLQTCLKLVTYCEPDGLGQKIIALGSATRGEFYE